MQSIEYLAKQTREALHANGIHEHSYKETILGNGRFWWNNQDELQAVVQEDNLILVIEFDETGDHRNSRGSIYNIQADRETHVFDLDRLNSMAGYMLQVMFDY